MISAPTGYYGARVRALDEKQTSVGTNIVRPLEFYASLPPKTENFAKGNAGGNTRRFALRRRLARSTRLGSTHFSCQRAATYIFFKVFCEILKKLKKISNKFGIINKRTPKRLRQRSILNKTSSIKLCKTQIFPKAEQNRTKVCYNKVEEV